MPSKAYAGLRVEAVASRLLTVGMTLTCLAMGPAYAEPLSAVPPGAPMPAAADNTSGSPALGQVDAALARARETLGSLDALIESQDARVERLRRGYSSAPDPGEQAAYEKAMLEAVRLRQRLVGQREEIARMVTDLEAQRAQLGDASP